MMRIRSRISESAKVGPFRFRLSEPLGRGRAWGSVGVRAGRRGWLRFSSPIGGDSRNNRNRRRRR